MLQYPSYTLFHRIRKPGAVAFLRGVLSMDTIAFSRVELENLVETVALEVVRQMGADASPWLSEESECACGHAAGSGRSQCVNDQPAEVRALARLMDHTLLRPHATRAQIEQFAEEARQWCF